MRQVTLISFLFALTSCGGGGSNGENEETSESSNAVGNISSEFHGKWNYIFHNTNGVAKIDRSFSVFDSNTILNFTSVSDNLIYYDASSSNSLIAFSSFNCTVNSCNSLFINDGRYFLIRSNIKVSTLNGLTEAPVSITKGIGSLGGVNISFKNVTTQAQHSTSSNSNGEFSLSLPAGHYSLEATQQNTSVIQPIEILSKNKINKGIFTLVENGSHNFKTTTNLDRANVTANSDPFFYSGFKYNGSQGGLVCALDSSGNCNFNLKITNIGSTSVSGVTIDISSEDPLVESLSFGKSTGGMEAGSSLTSPIDIKFKKTSTDTTVRLNIKITDINSKTWNDTIDLPLSSSEPVKIQLSQLSFTGSSARGYIIMPNNELVPFTTGNIYLPKKGTYYLVLSAPTVNSETKYSICVNNCTESENSSDDLLAGEPNDNKLTAKLLTENKKFNAYLSGGDIDFYKVIF